MLKFQDIINCIKDGEKVSTPIVKDLGKEKDSANDHNFVKCWRLKQTFSSVIPRCISKTYEEKKKKKNSEKNFKKRKKKKKKKKKGAKKIETGITPEIAERMILSWM